MSIQLYAFLLLIIALSTDAFAAGLSYGIDRVHIPWLSTLLISMISGILLSVSLVSGTLLQTIIPQSLMSIISFAILLILGINKLFDTLLHRMIKGANQEDFSIISPKEALILGLALSLDNIAAGIGSSLSELSLIYTFLLAFIINLAAIRLGWLIGVKASKCTSMDFSWVGAVLLFFLAFLRLFQ